MSRSTAIIAHDRRACFVKLLLVVAAALIDQDSRVLIVQRPLDKSLGGLWEFPGGKVELDERPEWALIRELHEELGIAVEEACPALLPRGHSRRSGGPRRVQEWLRLEKRPRARSKGWLSLCNEPCAHSLKVALTVCEAGTRIKKPARKKPSWPSKRYARRRGTKLLGEDAMMKPLFVALLCATVTGITLVQAQTGAGPAPRHKAEGLLNENYLTSTGETVPHPGASQGAATTDFDRRIGRRNNHVVQSICSNCD
jgi:8-oxo-dGTP pyrophosphatase MutT (NUDIX family)